MKVLVSAIALDRFEELLRENNIEILNRKRSYKNKIFEIATDTKMAKKIIMDNDLEVLAKIL